ncbi:MAG: NAD-dependent epimerase/dehydratase family protein [Acidiferrobacterales bacterium]
MRVVVTGGAGFIGSHVVDALLPKGIDVAVIDNLSTGHRKNLSRNAKLYQVDLRDRENVFKVFREFKPTHVSHQAAQASVKVSVDAPNYDAEVNVLGGLNVLDAAREVGVGKVVFASTGGAIYGEVPEGEQANEDWPVQPKSPYAASKAAFETYLEVYQNNYGLEYVTLRYGNVYGPRQDPHGEAGVVAIFTQRMLGGKPIILFARRKPGDSGCVRDYVYVGDVVAANLVALERDFRGVYNVGTGIGRSTLEVYDCIASTLDRVGTIEYAPRRPGDIEVSMLDASRLSGLGWSPEIEFEEGIRRTVAWFRDTQR